MVTLKLKKSVTLYATFFLSSLYAQSPITDEIALIKAFQDASNNPQIHTILLKEASEISLHQPLIFSGRQKLHIQGANSTIDASALKTDTLTFTNDADIKIDALTITKSTQNGLSFMIPKNSSKKRLLIELNHLSITKSQGFGLYIYDESNGSVDLHLQNGTFTDNGIGASDRDAIRIDERHAGSIHALIKSSLIKHNGGDGIELDERGPGEVHAHIHRVRLLENGFYDNEDLEDGIDIDESGAGDLTVHMQDVTLFDNSSQGLDFNEKGRGNLMAKFSHITIRNSRKEGIKLREKDQGNIVFKLYKSAIEQSGKEGIDVVETGTGSIQSKLKNISLRHNQKADLKIKQWLIKDEKSIVEKAGFLSLKSLQNPESNQTAAIKLHNIKRY